jgi:hypothetical protein
MACPEALNYTPGDLQRDDYSRDLRLVEWGSEIKLHSTILGR